MVVERDARGHGGGHAEPLATLHHRPAQRLRVGREVAHRVAGRLQRAQRVLQAGEHGKVGRGPSGARVGREVEQHGRDPALGAGGPAQRHEVGHPRGQHRGAFGVGDHVALAGDAVAAGAGGLRGTPAAASAEHHWVGGAVQLRERHHHRGLHRQQAAGVGVPLPQGLELDRRGREVGHVQRR